MEQLVFTKVSAKRREGLRRRRDQSQYQELWDTLLGGDTVELKLDRAGISRLRASWGHAPQAKTHTLHLIQDDGVVVGWAEQKK